MNDTSDFQIVNFQDIVPNVWDAFVDDCSEAWFYHRCFWMKNIESDYRGQKNLSFAICDSSGQILAIIGLFLSRGSLGAKKLITGAASGLAISGDISKKNRKKIYNLVDSRLDFLAKRESVISIQMRLPNEAPAWINHDGYIGSHLENFGYTLGLKYGRIPYHTPAVCSLIPLLSDEEILRGFTGGRKSNLAKSKLIGRRVILPEEISLAEAVDAYYDISVSMQARTSQPVVPKPVLSDIVNYLSKMRKGGVYLVQREDGVFLAGNIIIHFKNVAMNYLAATRVDNFGEKAGTMALWEAMKNERQRGAQWFELGSYFPCLDHSDKMFLIGDFKRSFGGRKFLALQGEKILRPLSALLQEDLPRYIYHNMVLLKGLILKKK